MHTWLEALKEWNAKKGGKYVIPKKDSPEYAQVKAIMKHEKEPKEAKKEKAKK